MLSTILIIDKRKELSTKYKKSLNESDTVIAKTLKDAMIKIHDLEPDIIIVSDSIDEELSGFCQKIRALTYNYRPIIVALSKSADINDRIKILESGADDFLSEPVDIEEFKSRIKAHLRRDIETNLDNKTLLPNKKIIHKVLKRTTENQSILLIELKNIKEYETVYTEIASNKLIQTFVAIAKSGLEEFDFIGQLDETQFVIITSKHSAEKFAGYLTFAFDTVIPKFYSPEDVERGYMMLKGERYTGMRVNFVSILVGGLVKDFTKVNSSELLLQNLKEIKDLAISSNGSNYAFERVKLTAVDSIVPTSTNKTILVEENDASLKYLIQTTFELQGYDICEQDGSTEIFPAIVIMDNGDSSENLDKLKTMKRMSNYNRSKFIITSTQHDKSAILSAGADLYLPKPYEISELVAWVEYFLK